MDFNRDRWGRPLVIPPNGGKPIAYSRFSSHGQCLEDRFGLEKWKLRTAGKGLASRPDLFAQVAACPADDSRRLDTLMDSALEAGGSTVGAGIGTALHEFTQNLDLGLITLGDIPEPWRFDVDAYRRTIDAAGLIIDPTLVEVTLVNDTLFLAGTADRFYDVGDGTLICADIKTGKSIGDNPLAYIVQLAAYANSVRYDIETGERTTVGTVNHATGLLIHVPSGKAECTIYEVDLNDGLELAHLATRVRAMQKRRNTVNKMSVTPTAPTVALTATEGAAQQMQGTATAAAAAPSTFAPDNRIHWLEQRIRRIITNPTAAREMRVLWPAGVPTLKQSRNLTDNEVDRIVATCDVVEASHGIEFGDPDPTKITEPPAAVTPIVRTVEADIDEGDLADAALIRMLQADLNQLDDEAKNFLKWLTQSCSSAKASVSLRQLPSQRRLEIGRFLHRISVLHDRDMLRAVMTTVAPNFDIERPGRTIGRLTIDQARQAHNISRLVVDSTTVRLAYHPDGTPFIDGDFANPHHTAA